MGVHTSIKYHGSDIVFNLVAGKPFWNLFHLQAMRDHDVSWPAEIGTLNF